MTTTPESHRHFVPGMGVDWLLPFYDPFTRLLGLDGARRALLHEADLRQRDRVLDLGCGTGSLLLLLKRLFPDVNAVGVDPDEKALVRATRKTRRLGAHIHFVRGFSDALDFADASFDRVFSSFMFHHLERDEKVGTLREVRRVLKADGSLHLLDFGGPDSAAHPSHLPRLHSHHRLTDNDGARFSGFWPTRASRTQRRPASARWLVGSRELSTTAPEVGDMKTLRGWIVMSWMMLPGVMFGGGLLLRRLTVGAPDPFQATRIRAFHAHGGVLITPSLQLSAARRAMS